MQQYNLELQIYNDYRINLSTLKVNINRLEVVITKAWKEREEVMDEFFHMNLEDCYCLGK
jgi:hypothetical protein